MLLQAHLQHAERLFVVFMAMREAQYDAAAKWAGALSSCQKCLKHERELRSITTDASKVKGRMLQVSPMLVLPPLIQSCTVGVHVFKEVRSCCP